MKRGNLMVDLQQDDESLPMDSTLRSMAISDISSHEITSILERPVYLPSMTWSSTSPLLVNSYPQADFAAGTVRWLGTYNFPQAIFENSARHVEFLSGFQFFKADLEIELKVNPNPLLRGMLMMNYVPYLALQGSFRRNTIHTLASASSSPHKLLNLEEGSSLTMRVPYVNIYDNFDLSNSDNQFGTIFVYAITPLVGTEAGKTVEIAINARFVNPVRSVPTHKEAQSELLDKRALDRVRTRALVAESDSGPVVSNDTGEEKASGPISSIAAKVATASHILSDIPKIGSVASTVSWVSRFIGKTASVFGFSKPISIQPPNKMIVKPACSMMHVEGTSDATTLGLIQDNGIDPSSFIPATHDEMSLKFILSRPNIFKVKTIKKADFQQGKLLAAFPVSPFTPELISATETDKQTMYLGTFSYTCLAFASLWRGTIIYDIHMVKTVQHRGRYAICFLPETNIADVPATRGELVTKTYSTIVNLNDNSQETGRTCVSFPVPYMSNTPFRQTFKLTDNTPDTSTIETKTGCVAIYAITDLDVNEAIVNPDMELVITHRAGPDFELARPFMNLAPGYTGAYAEGDYGDVVIPESTGDPFVSTSHDVTGGTTGEKFTSLRQLIKRSGRFCKLRPYSDYVGIKPLRHVEAATGTKIGYRNLGTIEVPVIGEPTPFYMASFLYMFQAGSWSSQVFPQSPDTHFKSYVRADDIDTSITTIPANDEIGQPVRREPMRNSMVHEIRMPWYRAIRGDVISSAQKALLDEPRWCVKFDSNDDQPAEMYEHAGDDFSYYFLRGPPPMVSIKQVNPQISNVLPPVEVTYTMSPFNAFVSGLLPGLEIFLTFDAISPAMNQDVEEVYRILGGSQTNIIADLVGGGTELISLSSGIIKNAGTGIRLQFPMTGTVDITATQNRYRSVLPIQVKTLYPSQASTFAELNLQSITYSATSETQGPYTKALITTTPLLPANTEFYFLGSPSEEEFTVTYTDSSTQTIKFYQCAITKPSSSEQVRLCIPLDITKTPDYTQLNSTLRAFGKVTALINLA